MLVATESVAAESSAQDGTPKKSRGANYDGGIDHLIKTFTPLLPWHSGYAVTTDEPTDETAFSLRKHWVMSTYTDVQPQLLV